jgi:hypothetical protein
MSIDVVRAALETVLLEVPEIKSASGWPTEHPGAIPFAFVGFDDEEITMAQREITLYELDVTVLVNRKGAHLPNEIRATEALIEPIKAKLVAKNRLGRADVIDAVRYTRVRGGIFEYAGNQYTGFVLSLQIKTHKTRSFSG